MRVVAVAAILIFVCWCAALALAGEPKLDAELAQARYYVGEPIATTTAVPIPTGGESAAPTVPAPVPAQSPAVVVAVAERGTAVQVTPTVPPPVALGFNGLPLAPADLSACDKARFYRVQAGLPERFDGIIWRESNCRPDVRNWCCTGLAQIHELWVSRLAHCGVYVREDLFDPQRNLCAAAYVYAVQGINAWSTA